MPEMVQNVPTKAKSNGEWQKAVKSYFCLYKNVCKEKNNNLQVTKGDAGAYSSPDELVRVTPVRYLVIIHW